MFTIISLTTNRSMPLNELPNHLVRRRSLLSSLGSTQTFKMFHCKVSLVCFATIITALSALMLPETDDSFIEAIPGLYRRVQAMANLYWEMNAHCLNQTGNHETAERIEQLSSAALLCEEHYKRDLDEFFASFGRVKRSKLPALFTRYCPTLNGAVGCLAAPLEETRKCADDKELYDTVVHEMLPEALRIACKNDGEIFSLPWKKCARKIKHRGAGCFRVLSEDTANMDPYEYGPDQCDELASVRKCVQKKLTTCKGGRLLEVFDLFYQLLVKLSPCEKMSEPSVVLLPKF